MNLPNQNPQRTPSWQINIAAEGVAAAQFARCGFDVSVQFGASKPAYDLVVTKADILLKVSVLGSEDGTWNLAGTYLKRAAELSGKKDDIHRAIELWIDHHAPRTICCLVQFSGVRFDQLPRIYLAPPEEIAARMRESAEGRGDSILYEGAVAGSIESEPARLALPEIWGFSLGRIQDLLMEQSTPWARRQARFEPTGQRWPEREVLSINEGRRVACGS